MISVTILTKDCSSTLAKTLDSLSLFPEVIVLDTGSSDDTIEIAKSYSNVIVYPSDFKGFGKAHNDATSLASNDWILSVDSDEIVSEELAREILSLELNPHCVYSVPRHNYYNGRLIRWCSGWHPDRIVRLYHRKYTQFNDAVVHEKIISNDMNCIDLSSPLKHTPYRNMNDFLRKMQIYTSLFAEQNRGKKASSTRKAAFHALYSFFKSYIVKKGFLGGKEGFIISIYISHTAFYKYLKLDECNREEHLVVAEEKEKIFM